MALTSVQINEENLYNVKILKMYVAYLREELNWEDSQIDQLFIVCGMDSTLVDFDDNWFNQETADKFYNHVSAMTGDNDIAYKVGLYATHKYAKGIAGRVTSGLLNPGLVYKSVGMITKAYSKGANIHAEIVSGNHATVISVPYEYCDEKLYQCRNRLGMLESVPTLFNLPRAVISHPKCIHKGDEYCKYEISWSENYFKYLIPAAITAFIVIFLIVINITDSHLPAFLSRTMLALAGAGLIYTILNKFNTNRLYRAFNEQIDVMRISQDMLERRHQESNLVSEINYIVNQLLNISELCDTITRTVHNRMQYDRVAIFIYDHDEDALRCVSHQGFSKKETAFLKLINLRVDHGDSSGFLSEVIKTQMPAFIKDVSRVIGRICPQGVGIIKMLNINSYIAVPISFEETIFGILFVDNIMPHKIMTENDKDLLASVARPIGLSFSNAKSFEQLENSKNLLENLVKERTKKLEIAIEQANRANVAMGNFLATMTHELRTPLNGITTVSDLLVSAKTVKKRNEYLNVITKSSHTLQTIINNILDYSKIENGSVEIAASPFNLQEVISNIDTILSPIASNKGIGYQSMIVQQNDSVLIGDNTKLTQILLNLSNNAIKFTNTGNVNFIIYPCKYDKSTNTAIYHFEITDTGIGIESDKYLDVFEQFKQADNTIARKYGGTGLGTTISKKLTLLMGGSIDIASILNEGTRIWVDIPLQQEINSNQLPGVLIKQSITVLSHNIQKGYIICSLLEEWGYKVECSKDVTDIFTKTDGITYQPFAVIIDGDMREIFASYAATLPVDTQRLLNTVLIKDGESNLDNTSSSVFKKTLPAKHMTASTLYQAVNLIENNKKVYDLSLTHEHRTIDDRKHILSTKANKILIVDDDETNLYVLNELATELGHSTEQADNANDAFYLLRKNQFDFAIIDYQMPEKDGHNLAIEYYDYAQSSGTRQIPLVLTSANMTDSLKKICQPYFVDYLEKPIFREELEKLIIRVESHNNRHNRINIDIAGSIDYKYTQISGIKTTGNTNDSLLSVYGKSFHKTLSELDMAIRNHDHASIDKLLHKMKGASAIVKANDIVNIVNNYSESEQTERERLAQTLISHLKSAYREFNKNQNLATI